MTSEMKAHRDSFIYCLIEMGCRIRQHTNSEARVMRICRHNVIPVMTNQECQILQPNKRYVMKRRNETLSDLIKDFTGFSLSYIVTGKIAELHYKPMETDYIEVLNWV